MSPIVLFGLPGAGKTFAGSVLKRKFNFFVQDGDEFLPEEMKNAIAAQSPVSDAVREIFFNRMITKMKPLILKYKQIALTQTFIKEKYRQLFLKSFPQAVFILVETDPVIREKRLALRKDYPLDLAYVQKMVNKFDQPHIPHHRLNNDTDGVKEIERQLRHILALNL